MFKKTLPLGLHTLQDIFEYCPRIYAIIDTGKYEMREYIFAGKYKKVKGAFDKKKRKIPIVWCIEGDRWVQKDLLSVDEKIVGSWNFSANYVSTVLEIINLSE